MDNKNYFSGLQGVKREDNFWNLQQAYKSKVMINYVNPIRPGLFSRSPGPRGGGAQRPGCQKSRLTSTD